MSPFFRKILRCAPAWVLGALLVALLPHSADAAPLKDARDKVVQPKKPAQRIISTSLASDEILIELLARRRELTRLLAVSSLVDDDRYSNVTKEARSVPHRTGSELESLLKHRPDLAIVSIYNRPETLERLERAGIPTFVLGTVTELSDIAKAIRDLGRLIHAPKEGEALAEEFETKLAQYRLHAATKETLRPTVLNFGVSGHLSGKGSTFHDMVEVAGGRNLADGLGIVGWQKVGPEKLATLAPQIVVAEGEEKDRDAVTQALAKTPGWSVIAKRAKPRLVLVPSREMSAVSHHVLKAVDRLSRAIRELTP